MFLIIFTIEYYNMEDKMINMESVQDYNEILGVETLHPLVSVVDLAEVQQIKHCIKRFDFYCIFLKQLDCGTVCSRIL